MIEVEKETGARGMKSEKRENEYGEEREKKKRSSMRWLNEWRIIVAT